MHAGNKSYLWIIFIGRRNCSVFVDSSLILARLSWPASMQFSLTDRLRSESWSNVGAPSSCTCLAFTKMTENQFFRWEFELQLGMAAVFKHRKGSPLVSGPRGIWNAGTVNVYKSWKTWVNFKRRTCLSRSHHWCDEHEFDKLLSICGECQSRINLFQCQSVIPALGILSIYQPDKWHKKTREYIHTTLSQMKMDSSIVYKSCLLLWQGNIDLVDKLIQTLCTQLHQW